MFSIERRAWVEETGSKVLLLRIPGADITLSFWKWWFSIGVYLHNGTPASHRWKPGEYDVIIRRTDKPDAAPVPPPPAPIEFSAEINSQYIH